MSEGIDYRHLIELMNRESLILERAAELLRLGAQEQNISARKLELRRFRIIEGGRK